MCKIQRTKKNILLVPRHDYTNTTAGNISETNMEATELISDDDEHSERLIWILDLGQKFGCQAERQCDLGWLVEVRLQNVPAHMSATDQSKCLKKKSLVEDKEALENLQILLVQNCPSNFVIQLGIRQGLRGLKTLVGESRTRARHFNATVKQKLLKDSPKLRCLIRSWIVDHGEVDIEKANLLEKY
jgi:hypothetical protein